MFSKEKIYTFLKHLAVVGVLEAVVVVCAYILLIHTAFSGTDFYPITILMTSFSLALSISAFIFIPKIRTYAAKFYLILILCVFGALIARNIYLYFDN